MVYLCTLKMTVEVLKEYKYILLFSFRWSVSGLFSVLWAVVANRFILKSVYFFFPRTYYHGASLRILYVLHYWSCSSNAICKIRVSIVIVNSLLLSFTLFFFHYRWSPAACSWRASWTWPVTSRHPYTFMCTITSTSGRWTRSSGRIPDIWASLTATKWLAFSTWQASRWPTATGKCPGLWSTSGRTLPVPSTNLLLTHLRFHPTHAVSATRIISHSMPNRISFYFTWLIYSLITSIAEYGRSI